MKREAPSVDRADLDDRLARALAAALVRAIRTEDDEAEKSTAAKATTTSRPAA